MIFFIVARLPAPRQILASMIETRPVMLFHWLRLEERESPMWSFTASSRTRKREGFQRPISEQEYCTANL